MVLGLGNETWRSWSESLIPWNPLILGDILNILETVYPYYVMNLGHREFLDIMES